MHQLIELDDISILTQASRPESNRIVTNVGGFRSAIVKFERISVCEIFGYLIANALGVRVPRMQGFWTKKVVDTGTGCSTAGRIGIFIEYYQDWKPISWRHASEFDPEIFARAIALCVLDRHEWGEFGLSGGALQFVDLERLFPAICPEELYSASEEEQIDFLAEWEEMFHIVTSNSLHAVVSEAAKYGLETEVREQLKDLCSLSPDTYHDILAITGYPIDTLISRFVASVFGEKLNRIALEMGFPIRDVPSWR